MGAKSNQGAPATGNTSTASTVNTGPWQPQQPYLQNAFAQAQAQQPANAAKTYYPGSTVAPLNQFQNTALNQISAMGSGGADPNVTAARAQNLSTINGDYLNSNPYVDKMFNQAGDAVSRQYMTGTAPQTAGAMAAQGRYGSGAYQNQATGNQITYGKTLNDLATNIYGGNYANERTNQMNATNAAPALNQALYINPMMALQAGNQIQQQQQAETTGAVNAYNYNRDQPTNALNTYLSQIQGNYGQSGVNMSQTGQQQQQPYFTNPGASALGGGLGLASLFTGGNNSAASGIGSMFGKGSGVPGSGTTI